MRRADLKRLRKLDQELQTLKAEGGLTEPEFIRIWRLAQDACAGRGELLNDLAYQVEPDWVRRLVLNGGVDRGLGVDPMEREYDDWLDNPEADRAGREESFAIAVGRGMDRERAGRFFNVDPATGRARLKRS